MRFTAAFWLCVAFGLSALTLPGCGSDSGPPGPRPASAFAERFSEAEGLADGPAKNEAFAKIASDAAAAGDVEAAAHGALPDIGNIAPRESGLQSRSRHGQGRQKARSRAALETHPRSGPLAKGADEDRQRGLDGVSVAQGVGSLLWLRCRVGNATRKRGKINN